MNISIINSLPPEEKNEAIIRAAINSPDIFIIKNKKCLSTFFKELVKRTIGTDLVFNNEMLESYKINVLERITKKHNDLTDLRIKLQRYALTYETAQDVLAKLYTLTLDKDVSILIEKLNKPVNDIELIRKSLRTGTGISLVNPFVEENDRQKIIQLIDKTKAALETKNDIYDLLTEYLRDITQDILHKYTYPHDGTRPFFSCGICIVDLDFCNNLQEAKNIIKSSKKCILLGDNICDEYIKEANELFLNDGILRIFDINEEHIIEKVWLWQPEDINMLDLNNGYIMNSEYDFKRLYHEDIDVLYWRVSGKEDKRTLLAAISKAGKKLVIIGNPEKLEDNSPLWDFYYECE